METKTYTVRFELNGESFSWDVTASSASEAESLWRDQASSDMTFIEVIG